MVHERVRLLAREQLAGGGGVAHVKALVRDLGPERGRRANVGDHDPLGLLTLGEPLDQPRADVSGAAGDQVAHAGAMLSAVASAARALRLGTGDGRDGLAGHHEDAHGHDPEGAGDRRDVGREGAASFERTAGREES